MALLHVIDRQNMPTIPNLIVRRDPVSDDQFTGVCNAPQDGVLDRDRSQDEVLCGYRLPFLTLGAKAGLKWGFV